MKKVQFYGFSHTTGYNGRGGLWKDGEIRVIGEDVMTADVKYLCKTFPDAFGPPKKAASDASEPAPKPKPKETVNAPVDTSVLDQSIANLTDALATGEHDVILYELLADEEAGKNRTEKVRSGAVAAIKDRIAVV